MKGMDAKRTAFVAMMSALGVTLSVISLNVAPVLSSVGQGGAALDLSHIATFIAAFFGGPYLGAVVGFVSGVYAGYYFGYVLGTIGLLSVIGVPLGKALTGLLAGFLYEKSGLSKTYRRSYLALPLTLLSYVPECIYTVFYFLYIVTIIIPNGMAYMLPIVIPKAWIEITVMSLIMGALAGNAGFRELINRSFYLQGSKRAIGK
jgi:riboflavin transporter FmnP